MTVIKTKVCPNCKRDLPLTSEYWNKNKNRGDGFGGHCKDCCKKLKKGKYKDQIAISQKRSEEKRIAQKHSNKRLAVNYLGGKCECCGVTGPLSILQFHHIDPKTKLGGWPWMARQSEGLRNAELDKCSLLCANCHTAYHNGDVEYDEWSGYKWKEPLEYKHRTVA